MLHISVKGPPLVRISTLARWVPAFSSTLPLRRGRCYRPGQKHDPFPAQFLPPVRLPHSLSASPGCGWWVFAVTTQQHAPRGRICLPPRFPLLPLNSRGDDAQNRNEETVNATVSRSRGSRWNLSYKRPRLRGKGEASVPILALFPRGQLSDETHPLGRKERTSHETNEGASRSALFKRGRRFTNGLKDAGARCAVRCGQ